MSCDCLKRNTSESDKVRSMAIHESKIERVDYVIYEEKEKTYYDRKSCWEKAGKPGTLREIIYSV